MYSLVYSQGIEEEGERKAVLILTTGSMLSMDRSANFQSQKQNDSWLPGMGTGERSG